MKKTAKNQIMSRIYGNGRGWVFSPKDFLGELDRGTIGVALATLAKEGKIRRVITGVYDYPKYSELLQEMVVPDIYLVAEAIARKNDWKIYPEGNTALNYLGLSTQVVARFIYLSDGPNRKYEIGNRTLAFKHAKIAEVKLSRESSRLVVQAIKAVGERMITEDFLKTLSTKYSAEEWQKIKYDTTKVVGWVYNYIREIADRIKE